MDDCPKVEVVVIILILGLGFKFFLRLKFHRFFFSFLLLSLILAFGGPLLLLLFDFLLNWLLYLERLFIHRVLCLQDDFGILLGTHVPQPISLVMKNIHCDSASISVFLELLKGAPHRSNSDDLPFAVFDRNHLILEEGPEAR